MGLDVAIVLGLIALILVLMALGLYVGAAIGFVGFLGYWIVVGGTQSLTVSGTALFRAGAVFTYIAVPLFLFMGLVFSQGGVVRDLYKAAQVWLRRIPGGLGISTVVSCGLFAAASGSSVAVAAGMARIAVPEMIRAGYPPKLAAGAVAAGGTVGMMIPPSIVMVIYALLTGTSVGRLFVAGVVPGVLSVAMYSILIFGLVRGGYGQRGGHGQRGAERTADSGPPPASGTVPAEPSSYGVSVRTLAAATWKERLHSLPHITPPLTLFAIVMGSIYFGFATPTEAAALGATGALLVVVALRRFEVRPTLQSARETVETTASVLLLFIMAVVFGDFLTVSGVTPRLAGFVSELPLPTTGIVIIILLMYLGLGFFLESGSLLILTMPVIWPVLDTLGVDGVWFGILVIKVIENAIITPPMGISVYVVNASLPEIPLQEIFKGVVPFIFADWVTLALLVAFPPIVLWLPSLMN